MLPGHYSRPRRGDQHPRPHTHTHTRSRVTGRTLGEGVRWLPSGWSTDLRPSTAASYAATGSIGQAARAEGGERAR